MAITRIFLLAAYAPASSAPLGELGEFWESVRDVLHSVRRDEKLIIYGDLNGWVGTAQSDYEGVLGQYGDKIISEAGNLLLEICKEKICL